jgi:hypothetical protein
MCLALHNCFFFCMSLFVSFICVYLLSHEFLGCGFIFFIFINKFSKYNQMNILFCMVKYLDLHLLILSISLVIVTFFFPFMYIKEIKIIDIKICLVKKTKI